MTEDSAVVDEIIASAEADTPEGRLERLEKEVNLLKGSIKRLLLDIRETMNNLENPFQNLAKLAESGLAGGLSQPQAVQVIPTPVEIKEKVEEEEEKKEEKEEKKEEVVESVESELEFKPEVEPKPEVAKPEKPEKEVIEEIGGGAEVKAEVKAEVAELTRYDIMTLFELMEWVKGMLEKYDAASLKTMLEIFEMAGYIGDDAKEFITKLVDLMSVNNGFEDMLLELYRLHKIMHPSDTSMDSKLLSLLLEKRL